MAFFKGIFWRFSGIFCPWTSYRSHILTQEHNILKILSLGLYLDKFSIVFQNFDFWPFYGLFYVIFLAFFGYFLSVNELQITHFDPGTFFLNMIFRNVSRNIVWNCHFWPYFGGGGLVYEHLWQETFAAGAVFRSSALCLLNIGIICCWVKKVHYKWVVRLVLSECQHIFCTWKCKPGNLTAYV